MPEWLSEIKLRTKALFRKRRLDRDLAEELAFHQAMLREKLEREGSDPKAAPAAVRQAFGDDRRWHERLTELWQFRWLENLLRDLSFATRILRRSPGFTSVALLTLILGIGANAAVFSLVNGLLLRPLPTPHSEELVVLQQKPSDFGYAFCLPIVRLLEKRTDVFQDIFAFADHDFQVRNGNRNESDGGVLVSGQFFSGLGVQPQLGRYLTPADDQLGSMPSAPAAQFFSGLGGQPQPGRSLTPAADKPDSAPSGPAADGSDQFFSGRDVEPEQGRSLTPAAGQPGSAPSELPVVISDQFWKLWFNRAPDVLGRKLILDNVAFTVVGVMPKSFIGADITSRPQIYAALTAEPLVDKPFDMTASGYHSWWLTVIARRKPGMLLERTNAALRAISGPMISEAIPDPKFRLNDKTGEQMYLAAEPGSTGYSYMRTTFRYPLLVVFVLCGAVLLLACLNLASLLTARAAAREREIATRLAIGATRRRVIQQLLVESMLLSFTGTLAGFALAPITARFLAYFVSRNGTTTLLDTGMDTRHLLRRSHQHPVHAHHRPRPRIACVIRQRALADQAGQPQPPHCAPPAHPRQLHARR
jgi:hypothetical protein